MNRPSGSYAVMAQSPNRDDKLQHWTVIGAPERRGSKKFVRCRCRCGAEKMVRIDHLRSGKSRSCGCLSSETTALMSTKHGYAKRGAARRREYRVWADAKKRCFNSKATHYERYGGRGITMCDRWRESFEAFLADMGPCPDGFSIDRIDNDGDYEPGNCVWVPRKHQPQNRRTSVRVSLGGRECCIAEAARIAGVDYFALHYRIRQGMTADDAVALLRRAAA